MNPAYNIRTDRWEIAQDAMEQVGNNKSKIIAMKIAQRENTGENQPAKADTGSAGTENWFLGDGLAWAAFALPCAFVVFPELFAVLDVAVALVDITAAFVVAFVDSTSCVGVISSFSLPIC